MYTSDMGHVIYSEHNVLQRIPRYIIYRIYIIYYIAVYSVNIHILYNIQNNMFVYVYYINMLYIL